MGDEMSFSDAPSGDRNVGIAGVVAALVTDNEDPERMGRVKLTFPWREDEGESYWARMATPMAGNDRGTYFLPEIGDEVLVAFENGDIHYPYVLGALWNGEDVPPANNADGKNDVRTIRSRSGHEIVLNDSDSEGRIEITTNGGRSVVLDDSSGKETIRIADGQNEIEFDSSQGTVSVSGGTKLAATAPAIEIKGDGNVDIEAGGVLTLKGSIININ